MAIIIIVSTNTKEHFISSSHRFPPASSELCRFGDPFRGGSHPVVEFLAAVGTSANADDILTYQKVRTCYLAHLSFIHWYIQRVVSRLTYILLPYHILAVLKLGEFSSFHVASVY